MYGTFDVGDLGGSLPPSGEVRLTLPLSDRFAVEPFVTAGRHQRRRLPGVQGFWGAQMRQRIAALSRDDLEAFATYGVAAYYDSHDSESPVPFGHFGFVLRLRLTAHVALRPDVHVITFHVIPIGARYSAGLSVDLKR